ncbi:hypothetical protein PRNP1_013130 [Phytophthora ramorum]
MASETPVTLSELVEFLETIDNNPSLCNDSVLVNSGDDSCSVNVPHSGCAQSQTSNTHQCKSTGPLRKRIRKVGSVPYSTDLQRRRKAELASLRSEVRGLEDRLAHLLQTHVRGESPGLESSQRGKCERFNPAIIARDERQCSERINRQLKEILTCRLHVSTSIQKLLAKNDIFKDIEFAFESQPMLDQSLTAAHTANFVLAEITKSMDPMYLRSNAVFPDLMGRSTVTLESYKKCHEMCGIISDNCIETISVTPVPCTIAESCSMLWHQLVSRKNVEPDKLYRFIRVKETSLEMSFTLPLRGENLQLLYVDAVSAYRKYEEPNRFVLVGKTIWFLRAGGLELETRHWTVISPPSSNPLKESVLYEDGAEWPPPLRASCRGL